MSSIINSINNVVFSNSFWFPSNRTWDDLQVVPDGPYLPQFVDLLTPFPIALVLIVVRFFVEKTFEPVARLNGLYDPCCKGLLERPPLLERQFRHSRRPSPQTITSLARAVDWEERAVERWFRKRRNQYKAGGLKKFRESAWKFFYYTVIWIYGIYILYDKPWVWWPAYCWMDYPVQHVTSSIYWYYMVQLAFYWSLTFTALFDVARKDFRELMIHHFITITLLSVSWMNNNVRVGTLVLVSHDLNDVILECGKMVKYLKKETACDILFAIFLPSWLLTRLFYFPVAVIRTPFFEVGRIGHIYPAAYAYQIFLCALLILHVFWFVIILRIALKQLLTGKVEDVRSESEPEPETGNEADGEAETREATKKQRQHANGVGPAMAMTNGVGGARVADTDTACDTAPNSTPPLHNGHAANGAASSPSIAPDQPTTPTA